MGGNAEPTVYQQYQKFEIVAFLASLRNTGGRLSKEELERPALFPEQRRTIGTSRSRGVAFV